MGQAADRMEVKRLIHPFSNGLRGVWVSNQPHPSGIGFVSSCRLCDLIRSFFCANPEININQEAE